MTTDVNGLITWLRDNAAALVLVAVLALLAYLAARDIQLVRSGPWQPPA